MTFRPRLLASVVAPTLFALSGPLLAADLRIGLAEDPDVLDPDQSRTFVGRIVYASLCDKLIDIDPDLNFVPELATDWSFSDDGLRLVMNLRDGVTFHDGTPFDAEAVVANMERTRNLPESRRKSEVASVENVEASGPLEVTFTLSAPDATLLAQLSDRAGMMMSPTAFEASGLDFGNEPVCSGPYSFVERIAQDRIVLEKYPEHWNSDAYSIDEVTYLPIPDGAVRLANLRSGDLDMVERLQATDAPAVKEAEDLQYAEAVSLGYQGITVNLDNGARGDNPMGNDPRVRRAFSLAIDREALNQVVFEGANAPGNQPWPPNSPWYVADDPVPQRDVEAAKALLEEAGIDRLAVEMQVANQPEQMQVAQVIQSMVTEAGFDVTLKTMEFASLLEDQTAGNYQASRVGWSGRVDPDGNIHQFLTCEGGINDSKFCDPAVDEALNAARTSNDVDERKADYAAAWTILSEQSPIIYLYHQTWIWALADDVEGFVPYPDGMIRLAGVTVDE